MKKLNILWFSDIHFEDEFNVKDPNLGMSSFDFLWNKFISKVKEIQQKKAITHVIISGDLVMSGIKVEYDMFLDKLIQLYNALGIEKPKLIVNYGNHDVNQNEIIRNFLPFDLNSKASSEDNLRDFVYCSIDKPEVIKIKKDHFKDFKNFITRLHDKGIPVVKLDDRGQAIEFDDEYGVCFNIINSSINSIGSGVEELLKAVAKQKLENSTSTYEIELDKVIKFNTRYREQGNQIYLSQNFSEDQKRILEENNHLVISIAHHPMYEWLRWDQLYLANVTRDQILDYSHIHLSSHEHIDPSMNYGYLPKGCLFLKSGMFSNVELEKPNPSNTNDVVFYQKLFPSNWFTMLSFNVDRTALIQTNYKFNADKNDRLDFDWVPHNSLNLPENLIHPLKRNTNDLAYLKDQLKIKNSSLAADNLAQFKEEVESLILKISEKIRQHEKHITKGIELRNE